MDNILFLITALADVADECDNRELYTEAAELTDLISVLNETIGLQKEAYIQQIVENGKKKYKVRSEKNSKWNGGIFDSKKKAKERLKEVEMFKHMK